MSDAVWNDLYRALVDMVRVSLEAEQATVLLAAVIRALRAQESP